MSPYKSFISAAKTYFNSVPFLKFLLSGYIFVFAIGGFLFLFGQYIFLAGFLTSVGRLMMFAGLLLTLIQEDDMTLAITSGAIALICLITMFIHIFTWYYGFRFEIVLYFLGFGAIALLTFLKSEKFKQLREASAARAQAAAGIACPRCGTAMQNTAAFCPGCGLPRQAAQPQQPPAPPQPPPAQQPTQPAQQPTQPAQQPAQPAQQPAQPAQPQQQAQQAPPASKAQEPEEAEQNEKPTCAACGADVVPGAAFCGKCGAKL